MGCFSLKVFVDCLFCGLWVLWGWRCSFPYLELLGVCFVGLLAVWFVVSLVCLLFGGAVLSGQ